MRKTKIFKSVVCSLVMVLALGSTAYAQNYKFSEKVRGKVKYYKECYGYKGLYYASGSNTVAKTTVLNDSGEMHVYNCDVRRYNYGSKKYDVVSKNKSSLEDGDSINCKISRDKDSYIYNYRHHIDVYNYIPALSDNLKIEEFTYVAKQYYE